MEELSGKTALVTGSTDGVGRLVARKLGQAGARVAVMRREVLASSPTSRPAAVPRLSLRPTSRHSPRCVASPTRPGRRWIGSTS
jgi:NAD(P)-dependent dehydrogenase (short-subunit alcohol dehydrogenase family)